MATKVHMEALSPTMEEGQLVRWLKKEGDVITEGDILAEIETDKATMELVARGSGVLQGITIKEGETAPVGQQIATIAAEGDAVAAPAAPAAAAPAITADAETAVSAEGAVEGADAPADAQAKPAAEVVKTTTATAAKTAPDAATPTTPPADSALPAPSASAVNEPARQPTPVGDDDDGRLKVSPLARRLATEAGVDLAGVSGTGPGGRITKKDIESAVAAGPATAQRPDPSTAAGTDPTKKAAVAPIVRRTDGVESEQFPVTQMRKTIAKRLVTSIGPVPTFYLTRDIEMTRVMEARERVNARLERQGVKVSVNDIVIKAVGAALVRHPEVNASWSDTAITRHYRAHIGVAVAVEDGLITPIVRDADVKPLATIAAEVRELAGRAREKKLKPEEYTGATFSISNLGMFGIEEFTAIINPPEAAILAIGAVEDRVVAVNGAPVVQSRMRITMSCDHRVIDGATGARFLQTLADFLEEPLMILV